MKTMPDVVCVFFGACQSNLIVYKKTDESYMELQQVTTKSDTTYDSKWYNEWQTSGTTNDNE